MNKTFTFFSFNFRTSKIERVSRAGQNNDQQKLSMGVSVPKMSTYKPADLIMIDGSLYKCIEVNF